MQSDLASSVFYVAALAFCKFSLLYFLDRIISAPQTKFKLLLRATWAILLFYLVSMDTAVSPTWSVANKH